MRDVCIGHDSGATVLADIFCVMADEAVALTGHTMLHLASGGEFEALLHTALGLELGHFRLLHSLTLRTDSAALIKPACPFRIAALSRGEGGPIRLILAEIKRQHPDPDHYIAGSLHRQTPFTLHRPVGDTLRPCYGPYMTETILTLTLNPAIDASCATDIIRPTIKIRTTAMRYDAGGGGINVAHVLKTLGSDVCACFLAGGLTGQLLEKLLDDEALPHSALPVSGTTRISHSVREQSTGREYRFVPEGPFITHAEWQAALSHIEAMAFSILVASGSLAPGVPEDFYAHLLQRVKAKGARMILDCSGPALTHAVNAGGLWMIKPSIDEFEALIGRPTTGPDDIIAEAHKLIKRGATDIIAVTMGGDGAILIHREGDRICHPPKVNVISTVGAGDSFVAGMTHRLAQGWPTERAFLYAMATGTAAVTTPGTETCRIEDVEHLFAMMEASG